jgi:hypothetical protein
MISKQFLLALSLAACLGSSHAAVSGFTSKAAFDAAIAGLTDVQTVDFEGVASGTTFASGTGTGGLTFDYAIPGFTLQVSSTFGTTSGTNYLGLDNPDTAFNLGDSVTLQFGRTVHAVGLYVMAGNDALAGDFELSVLNGLVLSSGVPDTLVSDGNAFYLGLVESDPGMGFTEATLRGVPAGTAYLAFTVDDITSGVSVVPEPSTYALMLLGVGALALQRRRVRR